VSGVTDDVSYLVAARQFNNGAQVLSTKKNISRPFFFLAAQSLECALKSYLSHMGISESELKKPAVRHNLEELWKLAVSKGAPINNQPTNWCIRLNELHNKPYFLRYPMGLNGYVGPNIITTALELQEIIESVETIIQPGYQSHFENSTKQPSINEIYRRYPIRGGLLIFFVILGISVLFNDLAEIFQIQFDLFDNIYLQYIFATTISIVCIIYIKLKKIV
jgi:hypothetical protein